MCSSPLSGEDDCFPTVDQDPVLDMISGSPDQDDLLDAPPEPCHFLGLVLVVDNKSNDQGLSSHKQGG